MPKATVAHIIGKQNADAVTKLWILSKSTRQHPGPSRIENVHVISHYAWDTFHHWLHPGGQALSSKTILNNCRQVRMARFCTERIISDLPVHLEVLPEVPPRRKLLKGEDTFRREERRYTPN